MKLTEVADRLRKLQDPKVVGVVYDGTIGLFDDKDIEAFKIAEKIIASIIPEEDSECVSLQTEDSYTVIQSGPVNMTIKNDGVMDITL